MTGDCHAPFRGGPGVRFPRATRPWGPACSRRFVTRRHISPTMTMTSRSRRLWSTLPLSVCSRGAWHSSALRCHGGFGRVSWTEPVVFTVEHERH